MNDIDLAWVVFRWSNKPKYIEWFLSVFDFMEPCLMNLFYFLICYINCHKQNLLKNTKQKINLLNGSWDQSGRINKILNFSIFLCGITIKITVNFENVGKLSTALYYFCCWDILTNLNNTTLIKERDFGDGSWWNFFSQN